MIGFHSDGDILLTLFETLHSDVALSSHRVEATLQQM
jgi:hypothetical protein